MPVAVAASDSAMAQPDPEAATARCFWRSADSDFYWLLIHRLLVLLANAQALYLLYCTVGSASASLNLHDSS